MNRETKRAMARQQKTADPQRLQNLRKQQLERQRAGGRDGQPGARRSRDHRRYPFPLLRALAFPACAPCA